MTLAKCKEFGRPSGKKHAYKIAVKPVGYPNNTAAVCGANGCEKPALVWLNKDEEKEYNAGKRIFKLNTGTMKVRVEDVEA